MSCLNQFFEWYSRWVAALCPDGGEVLFGDTDQLFKPCGILDCHIGQDLSVQEDIGLLQGIDKSAIG
jgi:hypothetical protein